MPAYSFQKQFVPFVEDGSKPHTMRKRRKRLTVTGDNLYLYYGLRTAVCRKIKNAVCTEVKSIVILKDGAVRLHERPLSNASINEVGMNNGIYCIAVDGSRSIGRLLTTEEKDRFAFNDGFRPAGTSFENPAGAFLAMHQWLLDTHALPFAGDIISWA